MTARISWIVLDVNIGNLEHSFCIERFPSANRAVSTNTQGVHITCRGYVHLNDNFILNYTGKWSLINERTSLSF